MGEENEGNKEDEEDEDDEENEEDKEGEENKENEEGEDVSSADEDAGRTPNVRMGSSGTCAVGPLVWNRAEPHGLGRQIKALYKFKGVVWHSLQMK